MHIGLLTSELGQGSGWANYSLNLIEGLEQIGIPITVVAAKNNTGQIQSPLTNLLPTVAPPDRNSLIQMASLTSKVRALLYDCDVIHATAEPYAPLAAWVAGKRASFITGHGTYVRLPQMRPFPVNQIYRRAFARSRMICVSHYTARVAKTIIPDLKTSVINNGIDPTRFDNLPVLSDAKQGPTIVTAGGVKARKGTLHLVRAVASLRQIMPEVRCVIMGSMDAEPKYVEQVKAEIEKLGVADAVQLLGFVSDEVLLGWYAAADVFVLPSMNTGWKFEGFGIATLEASAAGCPVIATRDCGAEDAVIDGETGLLVSQEKIDEELPNAIFKLLSQPKLAREMGAKGRTRALNQTWFGVAKHIRTLYETGQYQ